MDAIKDDQIHIAFDGWRGAFDYWTKYDSRDIFPVGWCKESLHPMQPPGQRNKVDPATNKRRSIKPSNTFIPDMDAMPAATPVTVHIHSKCLVGPFIDPTRLRTMMLTAPNHKLLAKLILQEILGSCSETIQLASRLFALEGEVNIITAASKDFTVKIPSSNTLNDIELVEFLKTVCEAAEACPNLITLEAGPEKCDNCCKQEKQQKVNKEESHKEAERKKPENDEKNKLHMEQPRQTEKQVSVKNFYKRRRESDTDLESSSPSSPTSSSSSNTSSRRKLAKIAAKSYEESVSTTTARNSQTQTVTATSTSG